MLYLLDTSALLAHYRGESGADEVQRLFDNEEHRILLASVSLAEFARRLLSLGASSESAWSAMQSYLPLMEHVPIDEETSCLAFEIGRETLDRLPLIDALIAAAAKSRGAVLVHRNSHRRAIPSGIVETLDLSSDGDSGLAAV